MRKIFKYGSRGIIILTILLAFILPVSIYAFDTVSMASIAKASYSSDKTILDFEWSAPSASYLAKHITSMERTGYFDGIVFYPGNKQTYLFQPGYWSKSTSYIDTRSLDNIAWKKWKGNSFLLIWSGDNWENDYWDSKAWSQILYNMEALGAAADAAGCAGILFDTEPYSDRNPWSYADQNNGHTLAETRSMVRKRGEQVMEAWEKKFNNITILGTFVSLVGTKGDDLLPYFVNGMLDGLGKNARLVDGNENTYNYSQTGQFFEYKAERKLYGSDFMWGELDPANLTKWRTQVQIGDAVYWDRWMGKTPIRSAQKQWVHNIYSALSATDQYVWVYTENMNWFGVPVSSQPMGNYVGKTGILSTSGSGLKQAAVLYRSKKSLGYDMETWSDCTHFVQSRKVSCALFLADGSTMAKHTDVIKMNVKITEKDLLSPITSTDLFVDGWLFRSYGRQKNSVILKGLKKGSYDIVVRVSDSNGDTATSNRIHLNVTS